MASNLVQQIFNRAALAIRAGISFGGARDLYTVFGWKRFPDHIDFVEKYLHQDVAQRIINAPVDATWTEGPQIKVGDTEWAPWKELTQSFPIFPALRKGDLFAGLGQFAILVVGIDDGKDLATPVRLTPGKVQKLLYLQPYLEGAVNISEIDNDQTSPRFGLPTEYRITPGNLLKRQSLGTNQFAQRKAFTVHYSRVLHLADNTLESPVFGHSRLEAIHNTLDDLLKITGGSAETFWLTANKGLHVDVDKEMELEEDDADDLADELDEYQHQLRRIIRTRGVKVTSLGSEVADPTGTFNVLIALLASQSGLPQRVMMGAEAGQLASQQDRANWSQRVDEREQSFAEPIVLIPFIKQLVAMGVLPDPEGAILVSWPEPFKMNPLERAQTSAQQARSLVNVARGLQVGQQMKAKVISIEESRQIIAPGSQILVLDKDPVGTFPPDISQPVAEPVDPNKLTPDQQMQVATEQANALASSGQNAPTNQPGE